ncbi:MAG: carboxypeptidase-like regulatory domain-containing protein [Tannerella sp.]|jgi:hypothetical protein|nr:carboxypeptidase-like regulatory domain-containing protein [Tannerella sp.]
MNKSLCILIILVAFTLPVHAQNIVKGSIHDESGTGIFSATLRILTKDSTYMTGGTTDDNGDFSIKNIKTGKYMLAVSYIGYTPRSIDFEMPDADLILPLVVLEPDIVALNEVVVKGSTFIRKKDHLLVIPDKQQIKHAFSGYDLLYNLMIPGLNVDRKNKTVNAASGTATLYINGVKADFREVQNLRPRDIEKVEYHSLPTGKYVGDAASINYITKTYKTGGYVTMEGEQNLGYLGGNYDVAAKVSHNDTDFTVFGGYNMKEYDGVEKEKNEELFFSDYTINRNRTTNNADFSNNQQHAQFRVRNNTEKRNLAAYLSFIRNITPHNDRDEALDYTGYNKQRVLSTEEIDNESLRPAISLSGLFRPTEKHQLKFNMDGSYTQNKYSRMYTENEQLSFTDADEDFYSFYGYGQYMYQPDTKNTFAGSLSYQHSTTSSDYTGDYESQQHLRKGETHLYLTYIREFGEKATLYINPGLSLLNYKLRGDELRHSYTTHLNTWLRYRINPNHWAGIGFSSGNYQPGISSLNSMDQTIDFYQIKRGNPNLDNTVVYNWYLMYEGRIKPFNIQVRAWHEKYDNNIRPDYYLEGDKLISSYRSDGSFNTANSDLYVSCRITESLRANLGLKYNYMYVPRESNVSQSNFAGSFDMNYFLKSFAINMYIKTSEKTIERNSLAFMETPASYGLSVRYSGKNWMAEAGTENPFTKHARYREYADYGVYNYSQTRTGRIYQQTVYIKLAYTFDFGKKTSRDELNVDRSINSGILKAK